MRIFPLALIAIGVLGVLKHYGLIDPAFWHLFWPLLLIGIGVPCWREARAGERTCTSACTTAGSGACTAASAPAGAI